MANALYPIWKQNLMLGTAGYDIDNDTVTDGPYCSLVNIAIHPYSPTDQFYSAIVGAVVGTDQRITAPTLSTAGVFDGNDVLFVSVPPGPSIAAITISRHNSGANTTWPLVMFYDQPGGGLPVTPNGGNISLTWSTSGIFQL